MKLAIALLLALAGSASAVEVQIRPDVNTAGCDYARRASVAGKTDEAGAPVPAPTCAAYLKPLVEGMTVEWAKTADDAAIDAAQADPAKRQRLVTEASK